MFLKYMSSSPPLLSFLLCFCGFGLPSLIDLLVSMMNLSRESVVTPSLSLISLCPTFLFFFLCVRAASFFVVVVFAAVRNSRCLQFGAVVVAVILLFDSWVAAVRCCLGQKFRALCEHAASFLSACEKENVFFL